MKIAEQWPMVRPLFAQCCKSLSFVVLRNVRERSSIGGDNHEQHVRAAAMMLAPYQMIAVAGCTSWLELGVFLAVDWGVVLA